MANIRLDDGLGRGQLAGHGGHGGFERRQYGGAFRRRWRLLPYLDDVRD